MNKKEWMKKKEEKEMRNGESEWRWRIKRKDVFVSHGRWIIDEESRTFQEPLRRRQSLTENEEVMMIYDDDEEEENDDKFMMGQMMTMIKDMW